ncbi:MAG: type 4a pilus biogenesis protein PilO [Proteobacteria bacterium]|jgi:Tfp pilus assembly protein PilO|nr:type 4a pilus biogenesis protein PilO [Pseudomonadota bacterium]
MDLAELKNIDVNQLFDKLKNSEILKDKKTLTKFGVFFGAFLISILVYYIFVSPVLTRQENSINQMRENEMQIENLSFEIENLKQQIEANTPEFESNSKLFHNQKEVEELYQGISNFALRNGLTIINIKKSDPKPVKGNLQNPDMGASGTINDGSGMINDGSGMIDDGSGQEGGNTLYYKIPVDYEIMGSFIGYLKFRRELSKSQKVINFDKEEINLLKEPQGQVLSKGTISIVGLPDDYK